jgi:hypothetical protein
MMNRRRLLTGALAILVESSAAAAQPTGPMISNFTITPPVVRPGDVAEIRFEYRNAQGGLREAALLARPASGTLRTSVFQETVNRAIADLPPASEGVLVVTGRHQTGYGPAQHGTKNYYQLQVTDRAGRRSNVLELELEVRLSERKPDVLHFAVAVAAGG